MLLFAVIVISIIMEQSCVFSGAESGFVSIPVSITGVSLP
jgi:hypothetical protein